MNIRIILDTDANNELDDQHAIAYLLFNGDKFDVEGITVNRTAHGGSIDKHLEEAQRVVKLCGLSSDIRVYKGADGSFNEIENVIDVPDHDGAEAIDYIINRANAVDDRKLVLLPIGKLTNIALAIKKDPGIAAKVRIVWLGSNYPDPGEYNQDNDQSALNYLLDSDVDFEIALVRYRKSSGTDAVRAYFKDIKRIMPNLGPHISEPVMGRHGKEFSNFGDYSVNLFENAKMFKEPPSRALFDMAAVAIIKDPSWATPKQIPAPRLIDGKWFDRPENPRKIIIWENFDKDKIMRDFYETMSNS